jgi:peroxiredoxin Q/BCP
MSRMPGLKTYLKLIKHGIGELISRKEPAMLQVGDEAPDFEVQAHDGSTVKLSDYRGKKVILWFYPKADTPG